MFTVTELVDQGYTEKHARQFVSREAVNHRNAKASLKLRRNAEYGKRERVNASTDGSDYADPKVVAQEKAAHPELDRGGIVRPTLHERMLAVQTKSTGRVPGSQRDKTDKQRKIRTWARDMGHKVSDFGRIPDSVIKEYEAVHGSAS